jgi:hypothetical protein
MITEVRQAPGKRKISRFIFVFGVKCSCDNIKVKAQQLQETAHAERHKNDGWCWVVS